MQRLQNRTEIPREVRKSLVGHSIGGGEAHEDYEGGYDISILHEAINKLDYPELDFSGVTWSDFQKRLAEWESKRGNYK